MEYTFNVLLSCMWQTDATIIEKSNLTSCPTIIINRDIRNHVFFRIV